MDVHPDSSPRQPAGSPGVVEVNVGEEQVGDIRHRIPQVFDPGLKCWDCRSGTALHEEGASPVWDEIRCDRVLHPKEI
jgi:hypothetical protein